MSSMTLSTLLYPIQAGVVALDERTLTRAFASFTEAAASLERSYVQLQAEVGRLRHELEDTNRDLASSLEENHRMRQHLNRILQGLPCGVLVTEADGQVSLANPEAERLLGTAWESALPAWIRELLDRTQGDRSELEYRRGSPEAEWITVRRAQLSAEEGGSSIFILQDVSELKRLEREHESARAFGAVAAAHRRRVAPSAARRRPDPVFPPHIDRLRTERRCHERLRGLRATAQSHRPRTR